MVAVSVSAVGCGTGEDDGFRSIRPGVEVTAIDSHGHGEHGGHMVTLRQEAGLQAEVAVDDERHLAVHFASNEDAKPGDIRTVEITLEHDGTTSSYDLVAGDGGTRFDLNESLPKSIRDIEDVAGELVVDLGGTVFRGSLTEHVGGHDHGSHGHVHEHAGTGGSASSTTIALLVVYCLLIMGASLFGGWLPSLVELTHDRMQAAMSVVGGLMLGIGVFHLLPHGIHELGGAGAVDRAAWWTMVGLFVMFVLLRTFHFHQHGPVAHPVEGVHDHDHDHDHDQGGHVHGHGHSHGHSHGAHELSWLGVFIGLSIHTLIDGIALAASVEADSRHGHDVPLYGLGTFLAVLLHKPLDAVSITTLMSAGGWTARHRNLVNLAYASMCPLGAFGFMVGVGQLGGLENLVLGCALCFAAGVFLCISLGDILPEMEFHAHNRVQLTLLLLAGIGMAWAIGFLEPAHVHGH